MMEQRINIAKLLKDCPKGMELDCSLYDNVTLVQVKEGYDYPIVIETPNGQMLLSKYGCFSKNELAKCIIFPKGKTTWEGFQRPYEDGDIVATKNGQWIGITTGGKSGELIPTYCVIMSDGNFETYLDKKERWIFSRLATEEEKQKLFDAIKDNGYKWNAETKTLERSIEPKFKVGDEIVKRNSISNSWIVSSVSSEYYGLKSSNGIEGIGVLSVSEQDNYEILPKTDKFDVTNFEPFMKVLVRSDNSDVWECDFFSLYNPKCSNRFHCIGAWYNICIPYIGNEHLRGTTNDCDEFYKTWE